MEEKGSKRNIKDNCLWKELLKRYFKGGPVKKTFRWNVDFKHLAL